MIHWIAAMLVAAVVGITATLNSPPRQSVGSVAPAPNTLQRPHVATREVFLMGTRVRLEAESHSRESALATIETGLRTLEAAEQQLSTWRPDSAISRINRTPVGTAWRGEPELCTLLAETIAWTGKTARTFDPTIGALVDAWDVHGSGRVPSPAQLESARARSGPHLLEVDEQPCRIVRRGDVTLDVGAFGKGEGLDRAAAAMPTTAWLIDLGGQISVGGTRTDGSPWIVDVAHPQQRDRAELKVRLTGGSLSTSGGSERDLRVDGKRVGHILDPRTAHPAPFNGSVSVWHERALIADILSTALYVMGPDTGRRWAEDHGLAVAFLVPGADGVAVVATERFRPLIVTE